MKKVRLVQGYQSKDGSVWGTEFESRCQNTSSTIREQVPGCGDISVSLALDLYCFKIVNSVLQEFAEEEPDG